MHSQVYIEGPYGAPQIDVYGSTYKCFLIISSGAGWTFACAWKRQLANDARCGRDVRALHVATALPALDVHATSEFAGFGCGDGGAWPEGLSAQVRTFHSPGVYAHVVQTPRRLCEVLRAMILAQYTACARRLSCLNHQVLGMGCAGWLAIVLAFLSGGPFSSPCVMELVGPAGMRLQSFRNNPLLPGLELRCPAWLRCGHFGQCCLACSWASSMCLA